MSRRWAAAITVAVACTEPPAARQLVAINDIAAGATCANGGLEIDRGTDDDRDGVLDASLSSSTEVL